jgi:hypothetical protein
VRSIHAILPHEPILVGSLTIHRTGSDRGRPVLELNAYCPFCRGGHAVPLPDQSPPLDAVHPFTAPCRSGPFVGETLLAMIDPQRTTEAHLLIRLMSGDRCPSMQDVFQGE